MGSVEEPPETSEKEAIEESMPAAQPIAEEEEQDESFAEAALIDPRSGSEAEERAYEEAVIEGEGDPSPDAATVTEDWNEPPDAEPAPDMFSPFAGEDDEMPRRRGGLTKVLIAALVIVALAVAFWILAPASVKARLGLASAADSPLQVSNPPHVERVQLASGNELLTVSGRVINPTGHEQVVPPLNAKLTNQAGKVVYSWTIQPPTPSLAAGASASFNSAEVSVPPGGEYLTITLGEKA